MRKHALVLLLFIVLALLVTWPLALDFSTHVVGDGSDDPALTWNIWWFKHAMLDLQISPLTSDYMFYPIGIDLVFYTLTLLNDALALPVYALFGLVPAANVSLLSSFVLSGYGAFLLAHYTNKQVAGSRRVSGLAAGAAIAGVVFAFSSNKLLYASLGQFNIASTQWIPFYALYLLRLHDAWERHNRHDVARNMLLAVLFLLLEAYAEFTFASFLVIFTAFFAIWQLRPLRQGIGRIGWLAGIGAVFAVGFLPILRPMLTELGTEGDIFVEGSGFAEAFSADLLGFFVPGKLNPLLGSLDSNIAFPYINFVFIGWLTSLLAILGMWLYRRSPIVRFWTVSTFAFAIIALGPELRIDGRPTIGPLPFVIFQWLPIFKGNRYPSRFSVMITLGVAVLVALGIQHVSAWLAARQSIRRSSLRLAIAFLTSSHIPVVFVAGALILVEHWSVLPLNDYTVPSFYQEIRADSDDFTVLELPLAWRNGFRVTGALEDRAGKAFMIAQFFQTVHEKPMLSGNTSRNPELKFQYFTEAPVINSLIALETGHELPAATLASDKSLAPTVFAFFNVRYIVVRPEAGPTVESYLKSVLPSLTLWREADDIRVYRLDEPPAPEVLQIDPKSPLARLYFGEGWGELGETRVWAQRNETRLLLPSNGEAYSLTLNLQPLRTDNVVSLSVEGSESADQTLDMAHTQLTFRLKPTKPTGRIANIVVNWGALFGFGYQITPIAPFEQQLSVVVKSAGSEVGDFAHVWILGHDWSLNQRGYNLVTSFQNPIVEFFDTFNSSTASESMAKRLNQLSVSDIALAVRDEATYHRTPALINALRATGIQQDIGWRWGQAYVRWVSGPGSAIIIREDASPIRPAIVSIGERITAPQVAGAVESIELRSSP